eukprot:6804947-Pyramimonas_sp.AAC.2
MHPLCLQIHPPCLRIHPPCLRVHPLCLRIRPLCKGRLVGSKVHRKGGRSPRPRPNTSCGLLLASLVLCGLLLANLVTCGLLLASLVTCGLLLASRGASDVTTPRRNTGVVRASVCWLRVSELTSQRGTASRSGACARRCRTVNSRAGVVNSRADVVNSPVYARRCDRTREDNAWGAARLLAAYL